MQSCFFVFLIVSINSIIIWQTGSRTLKSVWNLLIYSSATTTTVAATQCEHMWARWRPQCDDVTSFHEYPGIQRHLKALTLCLIPATSPQKNQFSSHKRGRLPFSPRLFASLASSSIPMMEIRLIKRGLLSVVSWIPRDYTLCGCSSSVRPQTSQGFVASKVKSIIPPTHPPHSPLISCQTGCTLHCQHA